MVRVGGERHELVLAELLELSPGGVEEVELEGDQVEYALYGAPGELPALPDLKAAAGSALVEVRTEEIGDDWQERWRRFHRPLTLGSELTVRPPWEPRSESSVDVAIDPGRAFGTGAHPTTRMCLELLLGLTAAGGFLDLGCGSGVLAVTAASLGWQPVLALDNDQASIEGTEANARLNRVAVQARRFDLRSERLPGGFKAAAANLLAPLLESLARRADELPARVIASGLLGDETDRIANAFAARGLMESRRLTSGEWAALLLERD